MNANIETAAAALLKLECRLHRHEINVASFFALRAELRAPLAPTTLRSVDALVKLGRCF
jgi:hypothetical protein